jgi:4-amino-4-deoxy-L-arabinose transferase-like glycosyltransferase
MNFPTKPSWFSPTAIATVLIAKSMIFLLGWQAHQLFVAEKIDGLYRFLEIWNRWDATHYLNIARFGYTADGEHRFLIVYFPLYPALTAVVDVVTGDSLISAFIVSGVASLLLAVVFHELVKLDHSERVSRLAVLFLFIFPTSYFLHIPYTESLFLALIVATFLAARKRWWLAAGLLGALACATRINGLVLIPALAFEIWHEYRERKIFDPKWLFTLMIPSGFVAYLLLNYVVTGDALIFLTHQREHWFRYFRVPWEGIMETIGRIDNPKPVDALMQGVMELTFVVIGLAALVIGWRWLRNSYRVWIGVNWLLFVSTSFVLSVPRYTLALFPIFILMGIAARKYWTLNVLFVVWSILFLSLFTGQFVRGWWAF